MQACIEEACGNPVFIAKALSNIFCAKIMIQLAKDIGIGRESLC
nr:hypothetical protein [Comamonas antarctica]